MFEIRANVIYFEGEPLARLLVPGPTTIGHHQQDRAIQILEGIDEPQCHDCGVQIYHGTKHEIICDTCAAERPRRTE